MAAADKELEAEVVALTREQGKFVAIQRYRRATGTSVKRARAAVEEILFRHGVFSMTRPKFRNWRRHLLVAVPACIGLILTFVLIMFFGRVTAGLVILGLMFVLGVGTILKEYNHRRVGP